MALRKSGRAARIGWGCLFASITLLMGGCGGGGSSSSDGTAASALTFPPLTQAQLASVAQAIQARDLSARDASVVFEDKSPNGYTLRILRHTVNGVPHYGIVTVPTLQAPGKLPVVVELDGWSDGDPPVDVKDKTSTLLPHAFSAIFVVPAFRGRTLRHEGQSWPAGGDVCDAFDGAASDTMALLNALGATEPLADTSRVLARGGSRGGSVALLLGQRDPRVKVVSAGSAPVDFYRQDAAAGYGATYQCQFITGKTPEQSRQAIIASSALHFPMLKSVARVYLDHGVNDDVVPLLNATEMNRRLMADGVAVDLMTHHGTGHDLGQSQAYFQRRNAIFDAFVYQR